MYTTWSLGGEGGRDAERGEKKPTGLGAIRVGIDKGSSSSPLPPPLLLLLLFYSSIMPRARSLPPSRLVVGRVETAAAAAGIRAKMFSTYIFILLHYNVAIRTPRTFCGYGGVRYVKNIPLFLVCAYRFNWKAKCFVSYSNIRYITRYI